MCDSGSIACGRSKLPTVTSIQSGRAGSRKVSAVPHAAQKLRIARADEARSVGLPATNDSPSAGTVAQVTNGAPVLFRQSEQ